MNVKELIISKIIEKPKTSIVFALLLSIFLAIGVAHIDSEYSHKIWFRNNDPYLAELDRFEKNFGNDEGILLIVETQSELFSRESIKLIQKLTQVMQKVPYVVRVDSLTNYTSIKGTEDQINILPLISTDVELTNDFLANLKAEVKDDKNLAGVLFSNDMTSAVIHARLIPVDRPVIQYNESLDYLKKELLQIDPKLGTFQIGGTVPLNVAFRNTSMSDLSTILPLVVLTLVLCIYFICRSFVVSAIILLEILCVIAATMGFAGWIGIKFSMLISMVPCVVAAIALADSIHIITSYRNGQLSTPVELLKYSLNKNFMPILFTSLTTIVGFLGLIYADIKPVAQLGILCAFGVGYAWLTSLFITSPLLLLLRPKLTVTNPISLSFATRYINFLDRFKLEIILSALCLIILSVFITSKNRVNSNIIKYFDENVPVRIANEYLKLHYGGYSGVQIVIDSQKEDGIHDPDFLLKVDKLIYNISQVEHVSRTTSLLDVLRRTHRALDPTSVEELPNTREKIAQELLLYELGLPIGQEINTWVSYNRRLLRVDVLWSIEDSYRAVAAIKQMRNIIQESNVQAEVTGKAALITGLDKYIVKTFSSSILTALFMIALLMFFIFKSIRIGIFSLIPNIIPPALGLGVLGVINHPIDVGVVLITSITLGIAVDDTIYFLMNYKEEMRKNSNAVKLSLVNVIIGSSVGLINTSIILILSFAIFIFGHFSPNQNFGMLTAIVLFFALVCDLVLLPTLLLWRKDRS